jgi:SAM-dependent methyltransferase
MQMFPDARNQEFEHLTRIADIYDYHLVCDIPSGGNYLHKHLSNKVTIIGVDSCLSFMAIQASSTTHSNLSTVVSQPNQTGFKAGVFDRVLSLAGIHHMQEKTPFFKEVARLLKPEGKFCIADVVRDSATAVFLDEIVDCYNSMGHKGEYLNEESIVEMKYSGLVISHVETIDFYWCFNDEKEMVQFCRLLFGLDNIMPSDFLAKTQQCLAPLKRNGQYLLPWQLQYISGHKA